MEEQLKSVFSNINDWLKFAEAKNGVLVALNGSAILVILTRILTSNNLSLLSHHLWVKVYLWTFIACVAFGLIIALFSFLAKVKIPWFFFKEEIDKSDNLLFYGHIMKYDELSYLERLSSAFDSEEKKEYSQIERYYANQIIVNSGTAMRKYRLFNAALWCTIAAVITPVIALMVWLLIWLTNDE